MAATALLALTATFLVPPADACGSGRWTGSDIARQEVVGVGNDSVEAYASQKQWDDPGGPCDGTSYAQRCEPEGAVVPGATVGPFDVGPFVVPEVRVLGDVVVPATTLGATVPSVTTSDLVVPAGSIDPQCVTTPYDAGAHAGSAHVGTDRHPLEIYRDVRRICGSLIGYTCSRLPLAMALDGPDASTLLSRGACASGTWSDSDVARGAVGVGNASVVVYASEARWDDPGGACDGMSYAERCGVPPGTGAAPLPPVLTPDVDPACQTTPYDAGVEVHRDISEEEEAAWDALLEAYDHARYVCRNTVHWGCSYLA